MCNIFIFFNPYTELQASDGKFKATRKEKAEPTTWQQTNGQSYKVFTIKDKITKEWWEVLANMNLHVFVI